MSVNSPGAPETGYGKSPKRTQFRKGVSGTGDISSAGLYQLCDLITPTVLIDEVGTAGDSRTLLHLLRTGNTRDVAAIRKNGSFKMFGAKAMSWAELPNDPALNSRCIVLGNA